jgi:micrococcal nuclease
LYNANKTDQESEKQSLNLINNKEKVKLIKVIDGDTLLVQSEKGEKFKVRLIGIDTPESSYNKKLEKDIKREHKKASEIINMGIKSKEFTKKLLSESQYLFLEYDVQIYDKYNRRLAYVYLQNGKMLNYLLVREGYAKLYTIPPNIKYQELFLKAEKQAKEDEKGLWKKE